MGSALHSNSVGGADIRLVDAMKLKPPTAAEIEACAKAALELGDVISWNSALPVVKSIVRNEMRAGIRKFVDLRNAKKAKDPKCAAKGCSRPTGNPHGFCFQHAAMAKKARKRK